MQILDCFYLPEHSGYVAGDKNGIVTVNGVPASRQLSVFDARTKQLLQTTTSNDKGNYLIMGLNPKKRYLVMCRPIFGVDDIGVNTVVWDFVLPMNDLTLDEQNELWQQMNSNSP